MECNTEELDEALICHVTENPELSTRSQFSERNGVLIYSKHCSREEQTANGFLKCSSSKVIVPSDPQGFTHGA